MSNFLIVGGKRGLSKALTDQIIAHKQEVVLVEREQWELQRPITLLPFIQAFSGKHIIICAHIGFMIGEVLDLLIRNSEKTTNIMIIGSMVSETQRSYYYPYYLEKKNYDEVVRQFQLSNKERSISIIKPGLIDTEAVQGKQGEKMAPGSAAKAILDLINISERQELNLISVSFTANQKENSTDT